MAELPLNGRNALSSRRCSPARSRWGRRGRQRHRSQHQYRFQRQWCAAQQSSYMLDGGLNMDMYNNVPAAFPNPDTLQEFSILQNSYSAVYGRNAGAVVNMITKSGTNKFHGTALRVRSQQLLRRAQLLRHQGGPAAPQSVRRHGRRPGAPAPLQRQGPYLLLREHRSHAPGPGQHQFLHHRSHGSGAHGRFLAEFRARQADHRGSAFHGNGREPGRHPLPRQHHSGQSIWIPWRRRSPKPFFPCRTALATSMRFNLSVPTNDNQVVAKLDHSFSDRTSSACVTSGTIASTCRTPACPRSTHRTIG